MKMDIRHKFPCAAKHLWNLTNNPVFVAGTDERARVEKTVVEESTEPDGRRFQRVRFTSRVPLTPVAAKLLNASHLTYDQLQWIKDDDLYLDWEVLPPISTKRFKAVGEYRILPRGENEESCERVITGNIDVGVPLVGRRIEETVVNEIRRSYDLAAEFTLEWLANESKAPTS